MMARYKALVIDIHFRCSTIVSISTVQAIVTVMIFVLRDRVKDTFSKMLGIIQSQPSISKIIDSLLYIYKGCNTGLSLHLSTTIFI